MDIKMVVPQVLLGILVVYNFSSCGVKAEKKIFEHRAADVYCCKIQPNMTPISDLQYSGHLRDLVVYMRLKYK